MRCIYLVLPTLFCWLLTAVLPLFTIPLPSHVQAIHPRTAAILPFCLTSAGHSLGGALAAMCAYDLMARASPVKLRWDQVSVYTFGAPRVGNLSFARTYRRRVPDTWHVINGQVGWGGRVVRLGNMQQAKEVCSRHAARVFLWYQYFTATCRRLVGSWPSPGGQLGGMSGCDFDRTFSTAVTSHPSAPRIRHVAQDMIALGNKFIYYKRGGNRCAPAAARAPPALHPCQGVAPVSHAMFARMPGCCRVMISRLGDMVVRPTPLEASLLQVVMDWSWVAALGRSQDCIAPAHPRHDSFLRNQSCHVMSCGDVPSLGPLLKIVAEDPSAPPPPHPGAPQVPFGLSLLHHADISYQAALSAVMLSQLDACKVGHACIFLAGRWHEHRLMYPVRGCLLNPPPPAKEVHQMVVLLTCVRRRCRAERRVWCSC